MNLRPVEIEIKQEPEDDIIIDHPPSYISRDKSLSHNKDGEEPPLMYLLNIYLKFNTLISKRIKLNKDDNHKNNSNDYIPIEKTNQIFENNRQNSIYSSVQGQRDQDRGHNNQFQNREKEFNQKRNVRQNSDCIGFEQPDFSSEQKNRYDRTFKKNFIEHDQSMRIADDHHESDRIRKINPNQRKIPDKGYHNEGNSVYQNNFKNTEINNRLNLETQKVNLFLCPINN